MTRACLPAARRLLFFCRAFLAAPHCPSGSPLSRAWRCCRRRCRLDDTLFRFLRVSVLLPLLDSAHVPLSTTTRWPLDEFGQAKYHGQDRRPDLPYGPPIVLGDDVVDESPLTYYLEGNRPPFTAEEALKIIHCVWSDPENFEDDEFGPAPADGWGLPPIVGDDYKGVELVEDRWQLENILYNNAYGTVRRRERSTYFERVGIGSGWMEKQDPLLPTMKRQRRPAASRCVLLMTRFARPKKCRIRSTFGAFRRPSGRCRLCAPSPSAHARCSLSLCAGAALC